MLGRDALERGEVNEALRFAHLMIEDEPADEGGWELAIRSHLVSGDRSAATHEFRRYRQALAARGEEPGATSLDALIADSRPHHA